MLSRDGHQLYIRPAKKVVKLVMFSPLPVNGRSFPKVWYSCPKLQLRFFLSFITIKTK